MTGDYAELIAAWETYDAECLRRPNPKPDGTYRTNNHHPTGRATLRMEAACATVAATLGLTTTELRLVLAALVRRGFGRVGAVERTVALFTVEAA